MRRFRRVHNVEAAARDVPLALYFFDCLLLDGRSLIDEPYEVRWAELERLTGRTHLAQRVIPADIAAAQAFLARALVLGHEGVMAKALSSPYAPGSRGKRWFKVKPPLRPLTALSWPLIVAQVADRAGSRTITSRCFKRTGASLP